jgi:hypothetical protein
MDWVNLLGYAAAASVLATFCMRTMIPLRILALVSNVLFCLYGYLDNLDPVLVLHLVLFPVSLYRLIQFQRLVHELQVVDPADLSIQSWIPHMKLRRMKAGETVIRQGDRVDSIYYLLDGIGKTLDPGAVVGETGVFASDAKRTANVVCCTDCRIYELS